MAKMEWKLEYMIGGCNFDMYAVAWNVDNHVAYACAHDIVILNLTSQNELIFDQCLNYHQHDVICVKYIFVKSDEILISMDSANNVVFTKKCRQKYTRMFEHHFNAVVLFDFIVNSNKLSFITSEFESYLLVTIDFENDYQLETIRYFTLSSIHPLRSCLFFIHSTLFAAICGTSGTVYICACINDCIPITIDAHTDWVRDVRFAYFAAEDCYVLATCSQDRSICVWKMVRRVEPPIRETILDDYSAHVISVTNGDEIMEYEMVKDAILIGHDSQVSAVEWLISDVVPLRLMSVGKDETVIIWEKDRTSHFWVDKIRFGNGDTLHSNYIGASFDRSFTRCICYGMNGHLRLWTMNSDDSAASFVESAVHSGHHQSINDVAVCSGADLSLIATASSDHTIAIFGQCVEGVNIVWRQLAVAVNHGHEINCVCWIGTYTIASGAHEKTIRIHDAPRVFCKTLKHAKMTETVPQNLEELANFAKLQQLNLSQLPCFEENFEIDMVFNNYAHPAFSEPFLTKYTLWPEKQLLYHHGNRVVAMAVNQACTILASACEARQGEHACIVLWDTTTFEIIDRLEGHRLSIAQMEFSPNDRHLVSVGKDRTFLHCFSWFDSTDPFYVMKGSFIVKNVGTGYVESSFTSMSWTEDSLYFGACSRDYQFVVFEIPSESQKEYGIKRLDLKEDINQTCFCYKQCMDGGYNYIFAISFKSCKLALVNMTSSNNQITILYFIHQPVIPSSIVTRIKRVKSMTNKTFTLAIISIDRTLRIINFNTIS